MAQLFVFHDVADARDRCGARRLARRTAGLILGVDEGHVGHPHETRHPS